MYVFKLWFFANLLHPFLFFIYMIIMGEEGAASISAWLFFIGFIIAIPALIFAWILYRVPALFTKNKEKAFVIWIAMVVNTPYLYGVLFYGLIYTGESLPEIVNMIHPAVLSILIVALLLKSHFYNAFEKDFPDFSLPPSLSINKNKINMEQESATTTSDIWQKSKLLIKGLIVLVLVLLLLIPIQFVKDLIDEREGIHKEAVQEVSGKWAGKQNIQGPIIAIPFEKKSLLDKKEVVTKHWAYFLPDKQNISGEVVPEKRHRGIYEVMLYTTQLSITGEFSRLSLSSLGINDGNMLWSEALLYVNVNDEKGLNEEIKVKIGESSLTLMPSQLSTEVIKGGFTAPLNLHGNISEEGFAFSTILSFKGSEQLMFTPVGRETNVTLKSSWSDPSFSGTKLPDNSSVTLDGFTAKWKSFAHARNFPQSWVDNFVELNAAAFGVDLFIPVSSYQKTQRSIKYAILCILLTFSAFFLIEIVNKKSVHPVQYALIGFTLVLFYTLLLSFSEQVGFNVAYSIASIATIALIAWFTKDLLKSGKLNILFSLLLVLLYTYVFTTLQLQDYALLIGSIGLFLMLGIVMYFSKRIKW